MAELFQAYFYALCDTVSLARIGAAQAIEAAGPCPENEGWDKSIRDSFLKESVYLRRIPNFCTPAENYLRPNWYEIWPSDEHPPRWLFVLTYSRECIEVGDIREHRPASWRL
jgi:hypothetical protein